MYTHAIPIIKRFRKRILWNRAIPSHNLMEQIDNTFKLANNDSYLEKKQDISKELVISLNIRNLRACVII